MDQNGDNEFNKIKDQLAYFDWNVITYLEADDSSAAGEIKDKASCLKQILTDYFARDRWTFPATRAHFLDINQGRSNYIDGKLEFLERFSRGWFLFTNPLLNFQLELRKAHNLHEVFDHYIKHHEKSSGPIGIDDAAKPVVDSAKSVFLEYAARCPAELSPLLKRLAAIMGDPNAGLESLRIHKDIRNLNFRINGKRVRYPELDKRNLPQDSESLKSLVQQAIKDSDFPFDSVESFFKMIDLAPPGSLPEFHRIVLNLSALSDFLYLSPEKLKKGTAFQSIMTDTEHLSLGLQCKWFISEDQRLLTRAKFIQTWLGINVQVFDIDSLVDYLLMHFLIVHNEENPDKTINGATFNFHDQNQNLIRNYEIKIT